MEFMELEQILSNKEKILQSFDAIMNNKAVVRRPKSIQWRFFRTCLLNTFKKDEAEPNWTVVQGAQYKFEVEEKLRRYYMMTGNPVDFVFSIFHSRDILRNHFTLENNYPKTGEYYLLIRNRLLDKELLLPINIGEEKAYIEKVVAACIDAEFEAYHSLPDINEGSLLKWFLKEGAAFQDLKHTLERLSRQGWVLNNPMNPSTKRLLSIKVVKLENKKATVRTTEYFYLRWWSTFEDTYRYPYRETNQQTYILVKTKDGWQVEENIRPAPKSSTPHRQRKINLKPS